MFLGQDQFPAVRGRDGIGPTAGLLQAVEQSDNGGLTTLGRIPVPGYRRRSCPGVIPYA